MIPNILLGLKGICTVPSLVAIFVGTVMGITVGALPGFTAGMGIAVLLPFSFGIHPTVGLALLGAIYVGGMYGGAITAILVNTPGTPAAAATVLDGYPMTQKGQAGEALIEAVVASFWGTIIGVIVLLFCAPPLADISLKFGSPEMFMLAVFGLTIVVTLTFQSILKGAIAGVLGLFIGVVGMDPLIAYPRYTFGESNLLGGVNFIPALIGLFSTSQVFTLIQEGTERIVEVDTTVVKAVRPTLKDIWRYPKTYLRSGIIGTVVGVMPAAGASIASFLGYNEGKKWSKTPEEFGKGCREGVAASEAANNGVIGGSLVPMLTLGIPGNSVSAILMGGLMIHGLRTGHTLFTQNAHIVYPFIISMFFAAVMMLFIGLYGAKYFAAISKTPVNVLAVMVFVFGILGAYAVTNNIFDVYIMFFFGIIGYLLRIAKFDTAPVVLGMILGPIAEKGLNQTIVMSRGAPLMSFMFRRPICIVLLIISIISVLAPILRSDTAKNLFKKLRKA